VLPDNNKIAQLIYKMGQDCFVLNGVIWKRLGANFQHRSVLLVPQHLIKEVLSEAHGQLLTGHFRVSKTKQRILQSYYWPNMDTDITEHLKTCDKCQITKSGKTAPELLSPLPQCTEPNQRIHADLFGPLKTSSGDKKLILCLTDAFTKYVELVTIPNKEAFTVATAILNRWICRFALPLEIVTDQGKEFTNQMAQQLFKSLNVKHTTTSSYHPQCNSQAEVCNKTIAKYLAAFVDSTTLDWEPYVPALMFAYNTSFHRSIQATPFSLTYGLEARLPTFFAPDFRRLHDPDKSDNNLLETLHHARDLAAENNLLATDKQKEYFDKNASHHTFHEGQYVLLNDFNFLNKNIKLAPKFSGPFKILRVKGPHNVELLLTNGRKIVVNVARIKQYFTPASDQTVSPQSTENSSHVQSTENSNHDFQPSPLTGTHTRKLGRPPTEKILSPPIVSFSKTRREKDRGEEENEDVLKNETKKQSNTHTQSFYANTHPMTTRAAAKQRLTDAQVTVNQIVKPKMDNSDKTQTLSAYAKLNNIIQKTYQCVTNEKKKKKLIPNKKLGQPQELLDPYKYSDYPETGITFVQHAPPAAAGQHPAAPVVPAPAAAPAAPAAAPPLPAPAPAAAAVPPPAPAAPAAAPAAAAALPPGQGGFGWPPAAAAAVPDDFAPFQLPADFQDLLPLPADNSDDSFNDEFFDANAEPAEATDLGEDDLRVEGEVAQDNDAARLEGDTRPTDSPPVHGFAPPQCRVRFSPSLQVLGEEDEEEQAQARPQLGQWPGVELSPGGAREGILEAHPIDPARSSVDQQALYYDALLTEVDQFTEEADRALQALQGATAREQLRVRNEVRRQSSFLRDELVWAERHLRPEALEAVRHSRQPQPPTRGEIAAGFQPTRALQ
jgi:hypothetical protein